MRPVYMEVTKDRYELPLAVSDSPYELARMRNVTVYPILQACKLEYQEKRKTKYRKVGIDEN